MKILCDCGHIIVDQTDYLKHKGYLISDTQWFDFWEAIDSAIEQTGNSAEEKEKAAMQLRRLRVCKMLWECQYCGKLYVDGKNNDLIGYSPDSKKYNRVLDRKEGQSQH